MRCSYSVLYGVRSKGKLIVSIDGPKLGPVCGVHAGLLQNEVLSSDGPRSIPNVSSVSRLTAQHCVAGVDKRHWLLVAMTGSMHYNPVYLRTLTGSGAPVLACFLKLLLWEAPAVLLHVCDAVRVLQLTQSVCRPSTTKPRVDDEDSSLGLKGLAQS